MVAMAVYDAWVTSTAALPRVSPDVRLLLLRRGSATTGSSGRALATAGAAEPALLGTGGFEDALLLVDRGAGGDAGLLEVPKLASTVDEGGWSGP